MYLDFVIIVNDHTRGFDEGYPRVAVGPSAHVIMVAARLPVARKFQIRHFWFTWCLKSFSLKNAHWWPNHCNALANCLTKDYTEKKTNVILFHMNQCTNQPKNWPDQRQQTLVKNEENDEMFTVEGAQNNWLCLNWGQLSNDSQTHMHSFTLTAQAHHSHNYFD